MVKIYLLEIIKLMLRDLILLIDLFKRAINGYFVITNLNIIPYLYLTIKNSICSFNSITYNNQTNLIFPDQINQLFHRFL